MSLYVHNVTGEQMWTISLWTISLILLDFYGLASHRALKLKEHSMHSNPAVISNLQQQNQSFSGLEAISLEKPPYNENWLQTLIHDHPHLVPAGEVEACFENIVPVLMEFTLPSGFLDNFYVTPEGYPVLVEVKLYKNQEARRKVVAQILEYAKDFAALTYEDINQEIRKRLKDRTWGQNPLHEIVSDAVASPPAEATFVDRVARNLREGRFLLLILGDGIREEMASLADYLMHHSLSPAIILVGTVSSSSRFAACQRP